MSLAEQDRSTTPEGAMPTLRLGLARLAILWERMWPALWPATAAVGIFLVLALFDLFRLLPGWLHLGLLVLFAVAIVYGIARSMPALRDPGVAVLRRRLERASGLVHRPLTALSDRLASGGNDPAATALWRAHRARMEAATRRLRVGLPRAGLATIDPIALRAALILVLLVAGVYAGDQWNARLIDALRPDFSFGPPPPPPSLDIWLTPPDYTGLPPQFLQRDHQGETVSVPTGSVVLAQVHGGRGAPQLALDAKTTDFTAVDPQNFKVSTPITSGHKLTVAQDGATLGSWPIQVIPDQPPTIEFATPPQPTQRGALRLEYHATDDYGVADVKAVITRKGGPPDEKIALDLPLPSVRPKDAKAVSFQDLTAHVWAGLPVEIRLVAKDAAGQTGESAPVSMTLPERTFHNPVARAIIDQRKQLTTDPTQRQAVSEILSDLSSRPGLFHNDVAVFLALRAASAQLMLDPDASAIGEVQKTLWDTALRVEDGEVSLAQRDLRELQQKLQEALARNAPDAEIQRLMDQLQQAMDRYLQSLAENMRHMAPSELERLPPVDQSRMVSRNDLQKMLDRARELARTGARDAARNLLSQLQDMLENLRAGRQMQAGDAQGRQMMRQMQDLMQRQQKLLDRSFRSSRQNQRGQMGQQGQMGEEGQMDQQGQMGNEGEATGQDGDYADQAGQQEGLRRSLGDMMRRLGENGDIPQPFGQAERAMRDAVQALKRGSPGQAVGPQTEALDQLQQAARAMEQQMMNQLGQGEGQNDQNGPPNGRRPRRNADRDPLGRERSGNGSYDEGDVKIPDQADVQKSREILDELRRRSGELQRPEIERDYIDRLLHRF